MAKRKFTGTIGHTMAETEYKYDIREVRPKDAPNVVYILMDDMGFAHPGCYGSNIHTPNLDRLANEGLRFNNFHTTAVCSATRASLLTGANHHAAGVSGLVELQTGCDNARGLLNPQYATIAEILKEYDYATFCSGKWHLANPKTQAGPYDGWPIQKGFERYYGFLHGAIDQFHPHLVRDNSLLGIEEVERITGQKDYHLSADLVDNAMEFIFTEKNSSPEKPFFLYLAFGAMHTPHHAPKEYIDRYKGQFDDGWDAKRQQWFERQKELGIIPQDAELTERNEYVEAWESLSENQKKVYARFMEAYAEKFREHAVQLGVKFKNGVAEKFEFANGFWKVQFKNGDITESRTVIYAAGAIHRHLGIDTENEFAGKGVSYCATCDGAFFKEKTTAVVGGGDTALDDALYLSDICRKVYLIHRRDEFRGSSGTVKKLNEKENVEFVLKATPEKICGEGKVQALELNNGGKLQVDGVFIAVGMIPMTEPVKDIVELDRNGYIIADETGKTSAEGFFVAGDVRTKELRQVVTAVSDGANAATSAEKYIKALG